MKIFNYKFYIFIFFIFLTPLLSSTNLYQHPYWLKLLHYENNKSIIKNKNFFLHSNGNTDPKKELIETLNQLYKNKNLQCRYPARIKWIKSKLNLDIPPVNCKKLDKYMLHNFKKISVVFTSPRYNSPGSVFGHTFLKLYSDTIPYAINYVAKVPHDINSFSYAYNGLTGKFNSSYRLLPFYAKDYEYRDHEARDLIEYDINLSQDEINNLLYHLYEIKDTVQDYYFLSRNCSSELIKLIDIAKYNSNIGADLDKYTIPIDIVYLLDDKNMLGSIKRTLSKMKLFYRQVEKLSKYEQNIIKDIVTGKLSVKKFEKNFTDDKINKNLIILSSIKYMELNTQHTKFTKKNVSILLKLIKLRMKYKIQNKDNLEINLTSNPITNKIHKVYFQSDIFNKINYNIIGYRHLYTSRYDLSSSDISFGSIELLDISLRHNKNKTELNHFTLLNLESIPPSNSFFKETTTTIQAGAKRVIYLNDNLYSYFNYKIGYNYQLTKNIYSRINGELGINYHNKVISNQTINSALQFNINNHYISELKYTYNNYDNNYIYGYNISFDNYIKISHSSTVKISTTKFNYTNQEYSLISLQYNYLF